MAPLSDISRAVLEAVHARLAEGAAAPLVVGICGAQGCGKSTLAAELAVALEREKVACAVLSLDDLYLTRAVREELAARVHPLLRTRGVPGTHDVALGMAVFDALARGEAASLPRFDKGVDDRLPEGKWARAPADTRVLLFEGWCVGALPQDEAELAVPVNALEAEEDAAGTWRRWVNAALAGEYQRLFARIDLLVLLAAPGFGVVRAWREEQEHKLRLAAKPGAPGVMDAAGLARFIAHYERLTRHILAEMPGRADLVIRLAEDRSLRKVTPRK